MILSRVAKGSSWVPWRALVGTFVPGIIKWAIILYAQKKTEVFFIVLCMVLLTSLVVYLGFHESTRSVKHEVSKTSPDKKRATETSISPSEYQKLMGVGIDVDYARTKKGKEFYNTGKI